MQLTLATVGQSFTHGLVDGLGLRRLAARRVIGVVLHRRRRPDGGHGLSPLLRRRLDRVGQYRCNVHFGQSALGYGSRV
jgi:hypothetical protein